jgi:hypothetical protein
METNMNPEIYSELREKAQQLIKVAYEFWEVHQKLAGPRAVVWLESTDKHFILFTRSEYKDQIIQNIAPLTNEIPLDEPFVVKN